MQNISEKFKNILSNNKKNLDDINNIYIETTNEHNNNIYINIYYPSSYTIRLAIFIFVFISEDVYLIKTIFVRYDNLINIIYEIAGWDHNGDTIVWNQTEYNRDNYQSIDIFTKSTKIKMNNENYDTFPTYHAFHEYRQCIINFFDKTVEDINYAVRSNNTVELCEINKKILVQFDNVVLDKEKIYKQLETSAIPNDAIYYL